MWIFFFYLDSFLPGVPCVFSLLVLDAHQLFDDLPRQRGDLGVLFSRQILSQTLFHSLHSVYGYSLFQVGKLLKPILLFELMWWF